jgi:mRNA-degrading endonuclease toxin of MazEF toxin-antitoxin module
LTPAAGDVWLADRGEETRRLVLVVSDARFHRLAQRAVIAAVLDEAPAAPMPWHIPFSRGTIAVNLLGTISVDRLLERVDQADFETLRRVRRAVREIAL